MGGAGAWVMWVLWAVARIDYVRCFEISEGIVELMGGAGSGVMYGCGRFWWVDFVWRLMN